MSDTAVDALNTHPRPRGTPLRRRLVALSAAAIIPLALMAFLGLLVLQQQQGDQARSVGLELSRSVANAVEAELRSAETVLETLATSPSIDARDLAGFRERAERVRSLRGDWLALVLSAPDGRVLVDTQGDLDAPDHVAPEHGSLAQAVRTRAAVAGPLTRAPAQRWSFPVHVPVIRDGAVQFVLTAVIDPEAIRAVLVRQQLPSDWVVSIIDPNGLRVARSRAHDENLGGRLSPTAQAVVDGGGTEGFGVSYTLEGERIFTPYTCLPSGWCAVLGFPTSLADAAQIRALATYGSGVLLSIGLAVLGAIWVARSITRPIAQLRRAAESVGRDQPLTLPDTTILEIRDVAAALGVAAVDLARARSEREALLRRERNAREVAESADRAKDEFMTMLSHELRTPLNAVFGWARLLQSGQVRDEATMERAMNAIVRSADAQVQLIDDLLDLSRIARGKLRLDIRRVELPTVLHAALDAVRPAAGAKGITLQTMFTPGTRAINGDAARLQQVVWNLLANAVKFTPRGGNVQLWLENAGSSVRIAVVDNGQGIEPAVLPFIFDRFRQADSSSTRSHGGLGLGLALVKHLVELHGGTVAVTSPGEGQGTTVTVLLPVAFADIPEPETAAAAAAVARPPHGAGARLDDTRVLVCDDDPEGLALAEAILARAGAQVRTCATAADAIAVLRQWRPDVLVSDIEMPDEDGYSLMRRIRALSPEEGGATPAIALTAYGRAQDRARSIDAGFTMHVPKPVDPAELTVLVASLSGRFDAPQAS